MFFNRLNSSSHFFLYSEASEIKNVPLNIINYLTTHVNKVSSKRGKKRTDSHYKNVNDKIHFDYELCMGIFAKNSTDISHQILVSPLKVF